MVSELSPNLASYRLLYFQPDPEDGERAVVAILVYGRGDVRLIYDEKFPKLRCLAPRIDPDLIGFFLDELARTLTDVDSEISTRLKRHGPQFVASDERKLAWPLSKSAEVYLIERFLHPKQKPDVSSRAVEILEQKQAVSRQRLADLVELVKSPGIIDIQRDATAQWFSGASCHKSPGLRWVFGNAT